MRRLRAGTKLSCLSWPKAWIHGRGPQLASCIRLAQYGHCALYIHPNWVECKLVSLISHWDSQDNRSFTLKNQEISTEPLYTVLRHGGFRPDAAPRSDPNARAAKLKCG